MWSLKDLSEKMRDIDIAMLSTHTEGGAIAGRPMSNNREVDFDGDSYYFAFDSARSCTDIASNPKVALAFQKNSLLGKPVAIAVEGEAELIRDKAQFEAHWTKELDRWFEQGIDTPGIVLIKVHAIRCHYWNGEEEGEITV